ncbi:MAG: putative membrane protein [Paraglaciecola sp.]|jgi:uncharacterized membrane protein|uniref:hypothetical protein n=1 Tax=Polaribacter sp. TaxID=1920175 RepID=UPI003AE93B08
MENTTVNEGKTAAIISHFWVIGLIIAFVMNTSKKNYFTSFYIRQMIGLNLIQFINSAIIYKYIGGTAGWIVGVLVIILWVLSLFSAIKGEEKEIPYVGEYFQKWFNGI